MKTTKFLLASLMMTAVLTLSAFRATEPAKAEANAEAARCPVTLAQMQTYLEECSHHHVVNSIQYTGCNGLALCDGGTISSTVYVENGIIVGHSDSGN